MIDLAVGFDGDVPPAWIPRPRGTDPTVIPSNADPRFVNIAVWNPAEPEGKVLCFPKKGYSEFDFPEDADPETGAIPGKGVGHTFMNLFYTDHVDPSVTAFKDPPATYYLQGGVIEDSSICVDIEPGIQECETTITSVKGKTIDVCHALGSPEDTHCTDLPKRDCKKINTCTWAGGACEIKDRLRL